MGGEDESTERREALVVLLDELQRKAASEIPTRSRLREGWRWAHYVMTSGTALLATAAGTATLLATAGSTAAGVAGLIAGALAALNAVLRPDVRTAIQHAAVTEYRRLSEDAELVAKTQAPFVSVEILQHEVEELYQRRYRIDKVSDPFNTVDPAG